jgi:hypothetical protein
MDWATIHVVVLMMMMTMMTSDMMGEPQDRVSLSLLPVQKVFRLGLRVGAGDLDILASG